MQTSQPLIKENLETHEKKLGDLTRSSEIPYFPIKKTVNIYTSTKRKYMYNYKM